MFQGRLIRVPILAVLIMSSLLIAGPTLNGSRSAAAQSSPLSTVCANRYNGDLRDGSRGCGSTEIQLTFPDAFPVTLCANRYNGDLRYSRAGSCGSTETALTFPDAGIINVCVNRYNQALRYSRSGACASTETARQFGASELIATDNYYEGYIPVFGGNVITDDTGNGVDSDSANLPFTVVAVNGSPRTNDIVGIGPGAGVTVFSDGGFIAATAFVDASFTYTISNGVSTATATVTLHVKTISLCPPLCF